MDRNDLTPDEVRFGRLLQTLDREPAAPSAEFLKTLRETSTQAFLKAQAGSRPARRVQPAPPVNPAVGRKLLRTLRIAMLSAVAILLVVGSLPPSVFPSRGVELQVAFDNLSRNNTVEIAMQNGSLANTLVFSQDAGVERLIVTYPSGNMDVIEPGNAYFVNRGNNSVHSSPVELTELNLNLLQDKVLAMLNVNDPQEQSLVLSQRPQSQGTENGRLSNYYHFETPAAQPNGGTLVFDATVDATTNSLMALNSRVVDSRGKTQFAANAGITGLNNTIAPERFQVSSQAAVVDGIATVNDVNGTAEVYDLMPLQAAGVVGGPGLQSLGVQQNWKFAMPGVSDEAQDKPTGSFSKALSSSTVGGYGGGLGGGLRGQTAPSAAGVTAELEVTQVEETLKEFVPQKKMSPVVRNQAQPETPDQREQAEDKAAPKMAAKPMAAGEGAASKAAVDDMTSDLKSENAPGRRLRSSKTNNSQAPEVTNRPAPAPVAATPAPAATASKAPGAESENDGPLAPKRTAIMRNARQGAPSSQKDAPSEPIDASDAPSQRGNQQIELKQQLANPQYKRSEEVKLQSKWDSNKGGQPADREGAAQWESKSENDPSARQQQNYVAPRGFRIPYGQKQVPSLGLNQNNFNEAAQGQQAYGNGSRLAAVKSQLRPGELLKTGDDQADIVRASLANDADLIVGPRSEVLLLKPTEIRLRYGEVAVDVPAGDQVDLLWGTEPELPAEGENYKLNTRNNYQQRASKTRRQVTGRAVFRVDQNQLQELERQPEWLRLYHANSTKNSPSKPTETAAEQQAPTPATKSQVEGLQKARAPEKKAETQQKQ